MAALALVCARSAIAVLDGTAPWYDKRLLWVTGGLWALIGLVLGGAAAYLPIHFGGETSWHTWFFISFALYLLATTAAAIAAWRNTTSCPAVDTCWFLGHEQVLAKMSTKDPTLGSVRTSLHTFARAPTGEWEGAGASAASPGRGTYVKIKSQGGVPV